MFLRRVAAASAIGLALFAGAVTREALALHSDLAAGRAALERARRAAAAWDPIALEQSLDEARAPLLQAERRARGRIWRAAGGVPVLGRTARALGSIAFASRLAADAANAGVQAMRQFPAGPDGALVGMRSGRVPLESWRAARPLLALAADRVVRARAELRRTPSALVFGPVARARNELDHRVSVLVELSRKAELAAGVLPQLLGEEGPRRYLLVVQNPAEARATGGLIGGLALVQAAEGGVTLHETSPNFAIGDAKTPVTMPTWFQRRYARFAAAQQWNNATMEPDFRVTAPLLAKLFESSTGERVDGVIATDVLGLAHVLRATGPLDGPGGIRLAADTFPRFAMREAYELFPAAGIERKRFLELVAVRIWRRALSGLGARSAADALAGAVRGRRLLVWSARPEEQRALEALGAAGRYPPHVRSFVGVVTQNAGPNKLDYYLRRRIEISVRLMRDGSAVVHTRLHLTNAALALGLPPPVLGERIAGAHRGDNRTFLSIYLPTDSAVRTMSVAGDRVGFESWVVPGAVVVSRHVVIPAGGATTVELDWVHNKALDVRDSKFGFVVARQPTARPDRVELTIAPPAGFRAAGSEGTRFKGGRVVWHGRADGDVSVAVVLSLTPLQRVRDWLGSRVL